MHPCPSCQATLQTPPHDFKADAVCDRCGGVWMSLATIKSTLQSWRIQAKFIESGPSADFCPSCGPVPLDEGTLLGQEGLHCSSCRGVFMRKALKYERSSAPQELLKPQPKAQTKLVDHPPPSSGFPQASPKQPQLRQSPQRQAQQPRQFKTAAKQKDPINSRETAQPKTQEPTKVQKKRGRPSKAKEQNKTHPKTTKMNKSNQFSPQPKKDLDFNKSDAAWIALLLIGISISLMYWMNP